MVVAPCGDLVAGPLHQEHSILSAEIDVGRASADHRVLDVAGHYGRDDIFQLSIDRTARTPIVNR
jgi:nitrilase